jgi:hypothetical protein
MGIVQVRRNDLKVAPVFGSALDDMAAPAETEILPLRRRTAARRPQD